jgi:integrase
MATKKTKRSWGQLEKMRSGRWRARYTHQCQRHSAPVTFTDKMAAEHWLHEERRLIESGEWTSPAHREEAARAERPATFNEWAETFMAKANIKARTRQDYRRMLDSHLIPAFGKYPLGAITALMVSAWHAKLLPGKDTHRAHVYALGRTVMLDAVRLGLITANPFVVKGAGSVKRQGSTELPQAVEIELAAMAMPDRYQLAVFLAAACGLRSGEVRALQRGDVNLAERTIKIGRGVTQVNGAVIVDSPKTRAGVRTVPIPEWLEPYVTAHLAGHTGARSDAWLFPSPSGGPLSQTALNGAWRKARATAGIPGCRFHDLRHYAATMAVVYGRATEDEARRMLGQEDTGVLRRYLDAVKGRAHEIAAGMPVLAGGGL